jgi:2-polyprenyl-3-methyl-5-hydroxy-6-metoxy-1,4-benzoquinol methylase
MRFNVPSSYHHEAYHSWRHPSHLFHRNKIDTMIEHVPDGSKVLDVGCGAGVFCQLMRKKGCDVYGFDKDKNMIIFAKRHCDASFCVADIQDFRFNTKFDVVVCMDVIEHFYRETTHSILKRLDEHLKEGGLLIMTFPTAFYMNFIEKGWRKIRNLFYQGIVFDDEDHHVIDIGGIDGYSIVQNKTMNMGMLRCLVLRKESK